MAITIPANMRGILKDAIADDGYLQIRLETTGSGIDGGTGVSDHGLLTGLSDDDHTQYLTQGRGDARYYTESEIDGLLSGLSPDHGNLTGLGDDDHTQYHTNARGDARYSTLGHVHDSRYYTETEVDALIGADLPAGVATISGGVDEITVSFEEQPNTSYELLAFLQNVIDSTPSHFTMLATEKTTTSFKIRLSGATDSENYKLNWAIGKFAQGAGSVPAHGELSGLDQDDHLQYMLRTDFTTYSGAIVAQIPTDFYTKSQVDTISGSLYSQIPTDYITSAQLTSTSGALQSSINTKTTTAYVDNAVSTLSGTIQSQINNLGNTYATDAELTAVSGALAAQIAGSSVGVLDLGSILTANETYKGTTMTVQVDTVDAVFGYILVQGTDFNYDLADADTVAGAGAIVMALESGSGAKKVLVNGQACKTAWDFVAGKGYVGTNPGEITQTKPSGSADQIQVLGWALSADTFMFDPTLMVAEIV